MSGGKVVQISHDLDRVRAIEQARSESGRAVTAYFQARESEQLSALRMAKLRRIRRDKRVWAATTGVACLLSLWIGIKLHASYLEYVTQGPQGDLAKTGLASSTAPAQNDRDPAPADGASAPVNVAVVPAASSAVSAPVPAPAPPLPPSLQSERGSVQAINSKKIAAVASRSEGASAGAVGGRNPVEPAFISKPRDVRPVEPRMPEPKPTVQPPIKAIATEPQATQMSAQPAQPHLESTFTVVGMPTTTVVLIKQSNDNTVRPVQIGQTLPSGETLRSINPKQQTATTDRRILSMGVN